MNESTFVKNTNTDYLIYLLSQFRKCCHSHHAHCTKKKLLYYFQIIYNFEKEITAANAGTSNKISLLTYLALQLYFY